MTGKKNVVADPKSGSGKPGEVKGPVRSGFRDPGNAKSKKVRSKSKKKR